MEAGPENQNAPQPAKRRKAAPKNTSQHTRFDLVSLPSFARHALGLGLYGWQDQVLADLDVPNSCIAFKGANGSGKTSLLSAPACLWHAMAYPDSLTVTTSGVFRQVKDQMWPQIRRMARRFESMGIDPNQTDFSVPHKEGESRVLGFSTDDPGKFEGWHASSLLLVLDEAKTIPDEIFEAVERCKQGQPTRVLMLSSPGGCTGHFYDAFHKHRHLWKTHTATAYDCPHIPREQIERLIQKWGIDHPLVRSMVFAEFMDVGGDQLVLSLEKYRNCLASAPVKKGGARSAFLDFAAGGDENVFCLFDGNRCVDLKGWQEKNTMAAVGQFLRLIRKYGLEPGEVYADAGGLGIPMCDALGESGFVVNRVNNGSTANESDQYANRGAEIWFTGARLIEQCEVSLPDDPILQEQCTSRRSRTDSKGRLGLESKEDMRKRGLPSPDRADALLGAIVLGSVCTGASLTFTRPSVLDMLQSSLGDEEARAGFDAGY